MAQPFDAASKHLIEARPRDWLELAGFPVPESSGDISIVDADLSSVIAQVRQRLAIEMPAQEGKEFLLAMRVLMGLKYQEKITESLMQSISEMVDSVEWQKIYRSGKAEGKAEGVVEGERLLLLRLGTQRSGTPAEAILRQLQSIDNADEISQLALKLSSVSNWQELLSG